MRVRVRVYVCLYTGGRVLSFTMNNKQYQKVTDFNLRYVAKTYSDSFLTMRLVFYSLAELTSCDF